MERDNLKAGLFVLCGAAALIVVTLVLADFHTLLEPRQDLQVIYRLSDGLQGLKSGAVVTLGGQPVGQVGSIEDVLSPADNQERVVASWCVFSSRSDIAFTTTPRSSWWCRRSGAARR